MLFALCACFPQRAQPAGSDAPQEDTSASPENTQSVTKQDGMQIIGTDELGYVSIPDNWVTFQDASGTESYQYSDPTGSSVITLSLFSNEGLTQEQKEMVSAKSAAQNLLYNLSQDGVEEVTGAETTLGGYEAYQVYGGYVSEDSSLPGAIVCWVFEDENKVIHYVAAEAPLEDSLAVVAYVQDSYSLTKTAA